MMIPKIDYIDHESGAEQMKAFYPGVRKEQLPGGLGWAVEFLTLTTHSGTHLDAPLHFLAGGAGMESMAFEATLGVCRVIEVEGEQSIRI